MWYPLALEEPTPSAFQPPAQFCLVQFEFEPIHSSTRVYTLCIRAPILVPRTICAHKFEHLNLHFVHREHTLDAFEYTPSCIRAHIVVHSNMYPRALEPTSLFIRTCIRLRMTKFLRLSYPKICLIHVFMFSSDISFI